MALSRERVALMVTFLTGALAARARSVESGQRQRMSHDRFVDHLVDVLTGALTARSRAARSQPSQRPSRSSPSVISSPLPANDSRTNSLPRRVSKSMPGAVATPVSSSRRRHQA